MYFSGQDQISGTEDYTSVSCGKRLETPEDKQNDSNFLSVKINLTEPPNESEGKHKEKSTHSFELKIEDGPCLGYSTNNVLSVEDCKKKMDNPSKIQMETKDSADFQSTGASDSTCQCRNNNEQKINDFVPYSMLQENTCMNTNYNSVKSLKEEMDNIGRTSENDHLQHADRQYTTDVKERADDAAEHDKVRYPYKPPQQERCITKSRAITSDQTQIKRLSVRLIKISCDQQFGKKPCRDEQNYYPDDQTKYTSDEKKMRSYEEKKNVNDLLANPFSESIQHSLLGKETPITQGPIGSSLTCLMDGKTVLNDLLNEISHHFDKKDKNCTQNSSLKLATEQEMQEFDKEAEDYEGYVGIETKLCEAVGDNHKADSELTAQQNVQELSVCPVTLNTDQLKEFNMIKDAKGCTSCAENASECKNTVVTRSGRLSKKVLTDLELLINDEDEDDVDSTDESASEYGHGEMREEGATETDTSCTTPSQGIDPYLTSRIYDKLYNSTRASSHSATEVDLQHPTFKYVASISCTKVEAENITDRGPTSPDNRVDREFACNKCERKYKHRKSMKRHYKAYHSENPPRFTCEICHNKFTTMYNLNKHCRDQHSINHKSCTTPSQGKDSYLTSKRHDKLYHSTRATSHSATEVDLQHPTFKYLAPISCTKVEAENITDRAPISPDNKVDREFACNKCERKYKHRKSMKKHYKAYHSENPPRFTCEICDKMFTTKYSLNKHCRDQHSINHKSCTTSSQGKNPTDLTCYICQLKLQSFDNMKAHMVASHCTTPDGSFKCEFCAKSFRSVTCIQRHFLKNHSHPTQRGPRKYPYKYTCKLCNKKYKERYPLLVHYDKVHGKKNVDVRFMCPNCSFTSPRKQDLIAHQRKEHPSNICPTCGKAHNSKYMLSRHMKLHINENEQKEKCPVCFIIVGSEKLEKHTKFYHEENTKSFLCDTCGKRFNRRTILNTHKKVSHSGELPYKCDQCPRAFRTTLSLRIHLMGHSGIRPFACNVCQKAFRTYMNLTDHMRTHTGEKPFVCPHCSKTFAKSCNMKKHVQLMHSINRK